MLKTFLLSLTLATTMVVASAQSGAAMTRVDPAKSAEASASAPARHAWTHKLKNHKPAQDAVDPESSPDKKGGQ